MLDYASRSQSIEGITRALCLYRKRKALLALAPREHPSRSPLSADGHASRGVAALPGAHRNEGRRGAELLALGLDTHRRTR
jgi:hypothetical protein